MFQADLLQDKVILVTGGGTGLGRANGERFLELGAKLAICGRRQEVAEQAATDMARRSGGEVVTIDGGEWIGGAGEFNKLSELTSQEWDEIATLTRGKKEGGELPNAN